MTKIPTNRIVAFLGPWEALGAGALAQWLLLNVHILGAWGIQRDPLASMLAHVLVLATGAGLIWLGRQKWLTGWQKWEERIVYGLFHGNPLLPDAVKALLGSLGIRNVSSTVTPETMKPLLDELVKSMGDRTPDRPPPPPGPPPPAPPPI